MARLSKILGPDGEPIDLDALFGPPKAGPSLASVRSPISGHPADGLTPSRLAAIHRAAADGDALAYLELAEDIEERDLHYLGVLGTRRRQVAQLPITIEAASEDADDVRNADFVRDWIKEGVLEAALFDLLDAVGKGFSIMEIEWESSPERVAPRDLCYRPQRWFTFDPVDGDTPMLIENVGRLPLPEHRFIVHRHKAKSGLTIRSGIARIASWAWMYKAFTLKDWAIFTQNYGMPIRLGKYHPSASDADKDALWRAVANIAGDCAAIVPIGMEIEFVEAKRAESGSAGELYQKRCDWMDQQISKLVLGQTTTTDAISGGHAVAKEHRLVQEDIERADARLVSTTLTRQLVRNMVAFNFGPQARYPKLSIGRPDEVPLNDVVNALDKLGPQGLTVELSQMRDRLGFDEPEPGVELVGGRQPVAPQGGLGAAPGAGGLADPGQSPAPPFKGNYSLLGGLQKPPEGGAKPPIPGQARLPLAAMRHLISRHAANIDPDQVELLAARLAADAAGALAGMTDKIRAVFDEATDLNDAAERLSRLDLSAEEFAEAMTRGMALGFLAGEASLIDEIDGAS